MIYNNVLEAMGNTPLIRLANMVDSDSAEILVKFEGLNVGGSIKTRTAYNMILKAEEDGNHSLKRKLQSRKSQLRKLSKNLKDGGVSNAEAREARLRPIL